MLLDGGFALSSLQKVHKHRPGKRRSATGQIAGGYLFQRNVIKPFSRAISDENVITLRCKYCIYVYWKTSVIFYFNFALLT
ncbi:hypothetical protein DRL62_12125 [Salmonella enterica subsp. enterica]|nr:hypothetical protein [Salmonella enterica subsp. enterica serovar Corvallis]EAA6546144.1 hypothetical protein [Salmonella enterica subsp. enterica serovar Corvallis]EAB8481051.1 hypothetical protein [Salmonella enterica subsp. enterica serovar Corvallis]EBS3161106.1 hypothetical protein [Salmonella enterica subsp. enterica serovar Corvallis]ECN2795776.1 hypothetical protein [Salmonella enterica subsp. enterica serovar Corvallis]